MNIPDEEENGRKENHPRFRGRGKKRTRETRFVAARGRRLLVPLKLGKRGGAGPRVRKESFRGTPPGRVERPNQMEQSGKLGGFVGGPPKRERKV